MLDYIYRAKILQVFLKLFLFQIQICSSADPSCLVQVHTRILTPRSSVLTETLRLRIDKKSSNYNHIRRSFPRPYRYNSCQPSQEIDYLDRQIVPSFPCAAFLHAGLFLISGQLGTPYHGTSTSTFRDNVRCIKDFYASPFAMQMCLSTIGAVSNETVLVY